MVFILDTSNFGIFIKVLQANIKSKLNSYDLCIRNGLWKKSFKDEGMVNKVDAHVLQIFVTVSWKQPMTFFLSLIPSNEMYLILNEFDYY